MNFRSAFQFICTVQAFLFFSRTNLLAQTHSDTFTSVAESYPVEFYKTKIGPAAKLYNGKEYRPYRARKGETPYLFQRWEKANLEYDGQLYSNVPIMIDLSRSVVIMNYKGGFLQLINEKISHFTVKGRKFVSLHPIGLPTGFYELLYDGNSKVYSLRQRQLQERQWGMEITWEFVEQVSYFIAGSDKLQSVSGNIDVVSLFPGQTQALKTYMRKNNLRFKKHFERDLIAVATYYDQLNK
ncbi:MAG: hypothetical protein JSS79_00470 [Bacteroidetes bacterium]|nr:hypothetical protein [Bacteroidota bacterium]